MVFEVECNTLFCNSSDSVDSGTFLGQLDVQGDTKLSQDSFKTDLFEVQSFFLFHWEDVAAKVLPLLQTANLRGILVTLEPASTACEQVCVKCKCQPF